MYSVSNPDTLVMSRLTIDDCEYPDRSYPRWDVRLFMGVLTALAAGDAPNSKSDGKAAGHNTDGFDCSTTDLTIEDRYVSPINLVVAP